MSYFSGLPLRHSLTPDARNPIPSHPDRYSFQSIAPRLFFVTPLFTSRVQGREDIVNRLLRERDARLRSSAGVTGAIDQRGHHRHGDMGTSAGRDGGGGGGGGGTTLGQRATEPKPEHGRRGRDVRRRDASGGSPASEEDVSPSSNRGNIFFASDLLDDSVGRADPQREAVAEATVDVLRLCDLTTSGVSPTSEGDDSDNKFRPEGGTPLPRGKDKVYGVSSGYARASRRASGGVSEGERTDDHSVYFRGRQAAYQLEKRSTASAACGTALAPS